MAEYLIQGETLESMADKIRILNGVEGGMSPAQMDSNLGEANTDVSTQADLIAQISSALEGKAGGEGGSASYDTCTVKIIIPGGALHGYCFTCFDGTNIIYKYAFASSSSSLNAVTIEDVICGSNFALIHNIYAGSVKNVNATLVGMNNGGSVFVATSNSGAIVQIEIGEYLGGGG